MAANSTAAGKTLDEIRRTLRSEMPRLSESYSVRCLELFGSFVRGDASEGSDLDILVDYDDAPTLFSFVRLENELSQILGVKVDLVMKRALKPALGERILAEAVTI
jgi:predicted nucleotidyltransferase